MTSNSCVQDQSACALPADIQLAVTRAWIGVHPDPAISTNRFLRALMKAMAPEAMLYLHLEEVRDLFKNGDLALGYGRAPLGEGAIFKACQALLRCASLVKRSSYEGTSATLVIINTPRIANLKYIEVRDSLRMIWHWASEASNQIYSTINDNEIAEECVEVYLFAVKSDARYPSIPGERIMVSRPSITASELGVEQAVVSPAAILLSENVQYWFSVCRGNPTRFYAHVLTLGGYLFSH